MSSTVSTQSVYILSETLSNLSERAVDPLHPRFKEAATRLRERTSKAKLPSYLSAESYFARESTIRKREDTIEEICEGFLTEHAEELVPHDPAFGMLMENLRERTEGFDNKKIDTSRWEFLRYGGPVWEPIPGLKDAVFTDGKENAGELTKAANSVLLFGSILHQDMASMMNHIYNTSNDQEVILRFEREAAAALTSAYIGLDALEPETKSQLTGKLASTTMSKGPHMERLKRQNSALHGDPVTTEEKAIADWPSHEFMIKLYRKRAEVLVLRQIALEVERTDEEVMCQEHRFDVYWKAFFTATDEFAEMIGEGTLVHWFWDGHIPYLHQQFAHKDQQLDRDLFHNTPALDEDPPQRRIDPL